MKSNSLIRRIHCTFEYLNLKAVSSIKTHRYQSLFFSKFYHTHSINMALRTWPWWHRKWVGVIAWYTQLFNVRITLKALRIVTTLRDNIGFKCNKCPFQYSNIFQLNMQLNRTINDLGLVNGVSIKLWSVVSHDVRMNMVVLDIWKIRRLDVRTLRIKN